MNWKEIIAELIYPCPVQKVSSRQHPKERYYNNKYPMKDIVYNGRFVPNTKQNIAIDVRDFFNEYDNGIRKIVERLRLGRMSDDDKALKCLIWIINNIKYVSDTKKGKREFWQFGFETLHYKTGDCEDGAVLMANMLLIAGVPYWKLRLSTGRVKGGAHAYLTYYCERKNRWVVLDWCYWVNKKKIVDRPDYKDEKKYLNVWFSWNQKYSFSKGLNEEAKKIFDSNKAK